MERIKYRRGAGNVMHTGYRKYRAGGRISVFWSLILVIAVGISIYLGNDIGQLSNKRDQVTVISVADGDTIRVQYKNSRQTSVRLIGVDTPETHHPTKPVGCFGAQASSFTKSTLEGKQIELEYDIERLDKYGRTLAYVYLDGSRFNDELLKQGYAKVLNIEPNSKYARSYAFLEIDAKKRGLGLWGACF